MKITFIALFCLILTNITPVLSMELDVKSVPSLKFIVTMDFIQRLIDCQKLKKDSERTMIGQQLALLPADMKEYYSEIAKIYNGLWRNQKTIQNDPQLALSLAIEMGYQKAIPDLICLGANLNTITKKNSMTNVLPLVDGILTENISMVELLLQLGANPQAITDDEGNTPFHKAVTHNWKDSKAGIEIMNVLLSHGADINAKTKNKEYIGENTPLHVVILYRKSTDFIKFLINNGADVNAKNVMGATPLMNAAFMWNSNTLNTLLENGADITITNNNGYTVLTRAQQRQQWGVSMENQKIITLLQQHQERLARKRKSPCE